MGLPNRLYINTSFLLEVVLYSSVESQHQVLVGLHHSNGHEAVDFLGISEETRKPNHFQLGGLLDHWFAVANNEKQKVQRDLLHLASKFLGSSSKQQWFNVFHNSRHRSSALNAEKLLLEVGCFGKWREVWSEGCEGEKMKKGVDIKCKGAPGIICRNLVFLAEIDRSQ